MPVHTRIYIDKYNILIGKILICRKIRVKNITIELSIKSEFVSLQSSLSYSKLNDN